MKSVIFFFVGAGASLISRQYATPAQISTIKADLQDVFDKTMQVEQDVNDFTGTNIDNLRTDSKALFDSIWTAGNDSLQIGPLSMDEAIELEGSVKQFAMLTTSTMDAFISKKPEFVAGCFGMEIYLSLVEQKAVTDQLKQDLGSKLPVAFHSSASQVGAPIADSLAQGVAAFADQASATCIPSSASTSITDSATISISLGNASATYTGPSSTSSTMIFTGSTSHITLSIGLCISTALILIML